MVVAVVVVTFVLLADVVVVVVGEISRSQVTAVSAEEIVVVIQVTQSMNARSCGGKRISSRMTKHLLLLLQGRLLFLLMLEEILE